MPANVTVAGFPTVYSARLFQKSTAEPGTCTFTTAFTTATVPDVTTVTIQGRNTVLNFPNMRVSARPRVHRGHLFHVYLDSRWILDTVIMGENFNERDELGRLDPGTARSVSQLWAEIATVSGLPISVSNSPLYFPTAPFKSKTARWAADYLLDATGSRMVWDGASGVYRVSVAGSGSAPPLLGERSYSPGPNQDFRFLHVDSAPILFESGLNARAVARDSTGFLQPLGTLVEPIDLFDGFASTADIAERSRYQQSALRLWQVTDAEYPQALSAERLKLHDRRAKGLASGNDGQLSSAAHPAANFLSTWPEFQFIGTAEADGDETLSYFEDTDLFHSNQPITAVNSDGELIEQIKIHTGYNVIETDGTLRRLRETRSLGSGSVDVLVNVPWIRPIDSDLPDRDTAAQQWTSLHSSVADSLVSQYLGKRETASVATVAESFGSGLIGAVLYELVSGWRGNIRTTWAFNFVPHNWRALRR